MRIWRDGSKALPYRVPGTAYLDWHTIPTKAWPNALPGSSITAFVVEGHPSIRGARMPVSVLQSYRVPSTAVLD